MISHVAAILGWMISIGNDREPHLQSFCVDFGFYVADDCLDHLLHLGKLAWHRTRRINTKTNIDKPKSWNLQIFGFWFAELSNFACVACPTPSSHYPPTIQRRRSNSCRFWRRGRDRCRWCWCWCRWGWRCIFFCCLGWLGDPSSWLLYGFLFLLVFF